MKKLILFATSVLIVGAAMAQENKTTSQEPYQKRHQYQMQKSQNRQHTFTQPYNHDSLGPGIHTDSTGKPFTWENRNRQRSYSPVEPNGYGLGVGKDQFGRPVYPNSYPNKD